MRDMCTYDYAVVRVVPRVEREEFVNVGVVVSCPARDFLVASFEPDSTRLLALDPSLDLATVERHLAAIAVICAGGADAGAIGRMSARERFRWLAAPRSAIIQFSAAHTGRCVDPCALLEQLLRTMVRLPAQA